MKNHLGRHSKSIELLMALTTLREDCCLFSKLLLYEPDKKIRFKYGQELSVLQDERLKREERIIQTFRGLETSESWKNYLFAYCNRIYKILKEFHHRLLNISKKLVEVGQCHHFLQQFRNYYIEKLSQIQGCQEVSQFYEKLVEWLRQRYLKEISTYNNNSSKIIDLLKKEQSVKINRYLFLIKDQGSQLFLDSHRKALSKIDIEMKKVSRDSSSSCHTLQMYQQVMNLDEETDLNQYVFKNSSSITFKYLEEGFCQFLTSKWQRMLKDLKSKNQFNETVLQKHRLKYQQYTRKTTIKASKNHKSTLFSFTTAKHQQKTMQLPNLSTYFQLLSNSHEITNQDEVSDDRLKKTTMFRLGKPESRKKSYILKPLGEHKQNKEIFPQKIVEMKLTDIVPQVIKNMRIRKKKIFPTLRDENCWSVLVRDQYPKLGIVLD